MWQRGNCSVRCVLSSPSRLFLLATKAVIFIFRRTIFGYSTRKRTTIDFTTKSSGSSHFCNVYWAWRTQYVGCTLGINIRQFGGGRVAKRPTQNIHAKCLRKTVFAIVLIVDATKAEVRFLSKLSIELFQGIQTFWR